VSLRAGVVVLCLAAVPVGAVTNGAVTNGAAPALRLVWFDPSALAPAGESIAREEASELLGRMGVNASWRRGRTGELRRSDEVWVVLIGGSPTGKAGVLVLGATPRKRPFAPIVWARVPNVCEAVGIGPERSTATLTSAEQRLVSVALGRVIAHEVVHAIVPSLPHGTGLMSDHFQWRELAAETIPIESHVIAAVQSSLRHQPLDALTRPRSQVASAGDEDRD
jgi:hypothetical protein